MILFDCLDYPRTLGGPAQPGWTKCMEAATTADCDASAGSALRSRDFGIINYFDDAIYRLGRGGWRGGWPGWMGMMGGWVADLVR